MEEKLDTTVLKQLASIKIIHKLYNDDLLSDEAFKTASSIIQPTEHWIAWARKMLLLLGSSLILAGIIFFFAYNWSVMRKLIKFGLIEVGIISCLFGSYQLGLKKLSGKILLLSASILIGVFLAVFGQTYQTGADAFTLFVGWSFLIFGWVIISKFAALWIVWIILINTGLILYWNQVLDTRNSLESEFLFMALAIINISFLFLYEVGNKKQYEWLKNIWPRGLLLISILIYLSIPTTKLIVEVELEEGFFGTLFWIILIIFGYRYYRFKIIDMNSIALIILNICVIALIFLGRILFDISDDGGMILFFAFVVLGVISTAIYWLKNVAKKMKNENTEDDQ